MTGMRRRAGWGCWPDLATTRSPTPFGAVPWARRGFTAEFGMGSGGARALWSPGRARSPEDRDQRSEIRQHRRKTARARARARIKGVRAGAALPPCNRPKAAARAGGPGPGIVKLWGMGGRGQRTESREQKRTRRLCGLALCNLISDL